MKLIKYTTYLIACMVSLIFLASCSDFLEEESQDEVIPKTTVDYRELLVGSGYQSRSEPSNFVYYMDDDVDFDRESGNGSQVGSISARGSFPTFTWQPSFVDRNGNGEEIAENPTATAYYPFYQWIMGCNAVLDYIDSAIGTQQERDRIKAEALAVRAFYYFKLVNLYGEPYNKHPDALAVPLKLNSSMQEEFMERATVAQVYERVVNDLKEALRLMEPLEIVRRDYHINQPAMHILLSRVYLYMENWQECVAEADKVFEKQGQLWDLSIYAVGNNNYLTYNNPEVEWVFGGNTQASQSTYIPSNAFIATFDENDKRKSYFSATSANSYFLVSKLPTGTQLVQTLRTSEALLNRAEAYARIGQWSEAMSDLNLLRRNRITGYADESISDPEELQNAIREERRKEFCYEGFRWFDLRRYGMPAIEHRYQHALGEQVLTYTLEENDPMYTLPFPNSLLLRNPKLQQNPSAAMGERPGY